MGGTRYYLALMYAALDVSDALTEPESIGRDVVTVARAGLVRVAGHDPARVRAGECDRGCVVSAPATYGELMLGAEMGIRHGVVWMKYLPLERREFAQTAIDDFREVLRALKEHTLGRARYPPRPGHHRRR